ncbi:MAG TPA: hypothetical protein VLV49_09760 [Terriglobales bacterium]|nr:hypothetical protein [Terriglobales bacterium]
MGRDKKVELGDIRQIGRDSERDISGICSACGTTLLARVDSRRIPARAQLQETLQAVFQKHVAQEHDCENSNGRAELSGTWQG